MTPQGKARFKIWLALLGVFALGAMTGGALDRVHCLRSHHEERTHHEERGGPGGRGDGFFQVLQSELALTDEQSNVVRGIIDKTRTEYRALRDEVRPRYDTVRQRERAAIRAMLTEDQQQKFDQMTARFDAKRRGHGRGQDRTK